MAALAWKVYNSAKDYIGDGTINLSSDTWKMALYTGASDAATLTNVSLTNLTSPVSPSWGYVAGGKTMTAVTWAVGTSAKAFQFDATATAWSASGGTITSIQFAVIHNGTNLLCFSSLSSSVFSVTDTNSLTITPHDGSGIFEMV